MKILLGTVLWLALFVPAAWTDVAVTNVSVKTRWPWNGLVDITYSIESDEVDEKGNPKEFNVDFKGIDNDRNRIIPMRTLVGDGVNTPIKSGGPYRVTWDITKDEPTLNSSAFQVEVHVIAGTAPYLVIDLLTWKKRYTSQPPNIDDDTCRTTELWLRQIQPGTFTMGSSSKELGRSDERDMVQHKVTLTQMFYIGIFECTQKQWELITSFNKDELYSNEKEDCRPVVNISYSAIRGKEYVIGSNWPRNGHIVQDDSFMGKLNTKTGLTFDLPTEAQWEYACRAGTTTALNSGNNLTSEEQDDNMAILGRYKYNQSDGKGGYYSMYTKVGCYLPNAWGLYDMHGNVSEFTLDRWSHGNSTTAETDPVGPMVTSERVTRGGCYFDEAKYCRSAWRTHVNDLYKFNGFTGFRVVYLP